MPASTLPTSPLEQGGAQPRSGKLMVAALVSIGVAVMLYFALGMPGMEHGSGSTHDGMDMDGATPVHVLADPAAFATAIDGGSAVLINVHIPYDGEIDGTDMFMPFDAIDVAQLPADRTTPLVVYCRSGNMSSDAVVELVGLGYTNVVELDGGMLAWEASGRSITRAGTADD